MGGWVTLLGVAAIVEFCPPRLGSDRRIYELLTRLSEGSEAHFVVFPPGRALLGLIPFSSMHHKDHDILLRKGIEAHYVSVPYFIRQVWKSYFLGYLLTVFYIWPKVFQKIRNINPNVIILNYPSAYTGLLGFWIGKLLSRKVVVEFNDIVAEYTMDFFLDSTKSTGKKIHGMFKRIIHHLLTAIQNHIVKNADLVTALTTYTIKYAQLLGIRDCIHLIPDGVDTTYFHPNKYPQCDRKELRHKYSIKEGEKIVVYVGRLGRWAGTELVLKCAERLKGLNVKFLLVGEGSTKTNCQTSNVIFSGPVPHELVPSYLAAADLVLVPMQHSLLGHSASPLKLFEAMAMMKPVIASNTKGIRDVIKNNVEGILLPPDEVLWSKAIIDLLEHPTNPLELGRNARKRVETNFDWNILAKKFERLLLLT